MLEKDLDLTGFDENELERGSQVDPDWYRVVVHDVFEDAKNEGTIKLEFAVVGGKFNGYKITDRLFDPDGAEDAEKAKVTRRRLGIFAKRLGLIAKEDIGKVVRLDWSAAVGREVAVKVVKRKYKDKNGNDAETVNIDFAGIFPLDDDRVPAEIRQAAGGATLLLPNGNAAAPPGAYAPALNGEGYGHIQPAPRPQAAAAATAARPAAVRTAPNYDDL